MFVNTRQRWHLCRVFTNICSLLTEKDGCACRNISIKFPCVCACACPTVTSSIFGKSFHFAFPYFVLFILRYFPFHVVCSSVQIVYCNRHLKLTPLLPTPLALSLLSLQQPLLAISIAEKATVLADCSVFYFLKIPYTTQKYANICQEDVTPIQSFFGVIAKNFLINLLDNAVINNPVVLQPIEGQSLPVDCWPHFHLSADRGERLSSRFRNDVFVHEQNIVSL